MLILAIDTSGKEGGITLAEAGENSFHVVESAGIAGGTFSAQLVPTLASLLRRHGHRVKDLQGFAAASGPGSFTGLRVGLSAIKGLAEVLRRPIAVVSVLEALAALSAKAGPQQAGGRQAGREQADGRQARREQEALEQASPQQQPVMVAAALDAGRREVFLGIYEFDSSASGGGPSPAGGPFPRKLSEELLAQAEFVEKLRGMRPAALVCSDRSVAELAAAAGILVESVAPPGSEMVARLGAGKLLAGETIAVEALDANYLRRSDAEIFFKAK